VICTASLPSAQYVKRVIPSREDGEGPRNCQFPRSFASVTELALERSLGALRQPRDDTRLNAAFFTCGLGPAPAEAILARSC
jgi:hypothetical protein